MSNLPEPPQGGDSEIIGRLASLVAKVKHQWLAALMAKHLPPDMLALAQSEDGNDRMKLAKYISASGFRIKEYPDRSELHKGEVLLGALRVRMKDGQLTMETKKMPPVPPPQMTSTDGSAI